MGLSLGLSPVTAGGGTWRAGGGRCECRRVGDVRGRGWSLIAGGLNAGPIPALRNRAMSTGSKGGVSLEWKEVTTDWDAVVRNAVTNAITEGFKRQLDGYSQSPVNQMVAKSLEKFTPEIRSLLEESIGSCVNSNEFREQVAQATREKLAKLLVQRFGGELEKQINTLKSDPTTRARIILAIEEIVKQKA